jgi:hypothetical protein
VEAALPCSINLPLFGSQLKQIRVDWPQPKHIGVVAKFAVELTIEVMGLAPIESDAVPDAVVYIPNHEYAFFQSLNHCATQSNPTFRGTVTRRSPNSPLFESRGPHTTFLLLALETSIGFAGPRGLDDGNVVVVQVQHGIGLVAARCLLLCPPADGVGDPAVLQAVQRKPVCGELSVTRPQAADTTRGSEIAIDSRRARSGC